MQLYVYESKEVRVYSNIRLVKSPNYWLVAFDPQIIDWLNIWNHQRATDLSSSGTPGYAWSSETRLSTLLLRCTRHKVIAMQPWRRANSPNLGDIVGIFTWIHAWTYIYVYIYTGIYTVHAYIHYIALLYICIYIYVYAYFTLHYINLHYIHYITFHYITLLCITLLYITLLYITLQ